MNFADIHRTTLPSGSALPISYESLYGSLIASAAPFIEPASFWRIQERDSARETLEEIGHLQSNWDGHGALPISKEAIVHTQRFLRILEARTPTLSNPEITPTSSGTIALEWETAYGEVYLEIGKTRFSFFARSASGSETRRDGLAEVIDESLPELVERTLLFWTAASDIYLTSGGVSRELFGSDYVVSITSALGYVQMAPVSANQFSSLGMTLWIHEGTSADPISYHPLEDLLGSNYLEATPTVSQIELAA